MNKHWLKLFVLVVFGDTGAGDRACRQIAGSCSFPGYCHQPGLWRWR
jgi:hypothetical protein